MILIGDLLRVSIRKDVPTTVWAKVVRINDDGSISVDDRGFGDKGIRQHQIKYNLSQYVRELLEL